MSQQVVDHEIRRYLESGRSDPLFPSWPGQDLFATGREADRTLRGALVEASDGAQRGARRLRSHLRRP